MDPSETEEGAEDEDVEDDHNDLDQIMEKPLVVIGRPPAHQDYDTANPDTIDPDTILRKPGEKRPQMELMPEDGEPPLQRQKLDELEKAYVELNKAHFMFQNASSHFKAVKASIPFINTPVFLKFR